MAKRGRKKRRKAVGRRGGLRAGSAPLALREYTELQVALEQKKNELLAERAQLAARVAEIDRVLAGQAPVRRGRPPRIAPAEVLVGRKGRRGRREPREGMTLGNKMAEILSAEGKPMRVLELVAAVKESDYPTKSRHLRSMIGQTLRRDRRFRKVRRGTYTLR